MGFVFLYLKGQKSFFFSFKQFSWKLILFKFFRFALAGGQQLEYDVVTGFFPIFGEFTNTPRAYFHHLMVNM